MPIKNRNISIGENAPDFKLMSLTGENVRLSQFQGEKNVVVVFLRGFL
jgi:peroxiredoxin